MKLLSSVAVYLGTAVLLSNQEDGLKPVNAWVSGSDCEDFAGSCSSGAAIYREHLNPLVSGYVVITGYDNGIDPKTGEVNNTLVVIYDLKGCNGNNCTVLEMKENRNFCKEVSIGELDPDNNAAGDIDIVEIINPIASNVETINVNTAINQLFDRPVVVQDAERRVLTCAMFKEITNNNSTEGKIPLDDKNKTLSGAMSIASASWVLFVASTMVIAAVL